MRILRHLPRFRKAQRAIRSLLEIQSWSRTEIESYQLTKVNQLWKSAVNNVPYYQTLQQSLGLPNQFQSLADYQQSVPILEKHQVRDNPQQLASKQLQPGKWHRTGGSTGNPTSVYWSNQAHRQNLQLRYAWLSQYDIDLFDAQAFLWGHAGSFAPGLKGLVARWRQPLEDYLRNRQRFSAYSMAARDLEHYLHAMSRAGTQWVYGYSSAVFLLANHAIASGIAPSGIKLFVMTGEPAIPLYAERVQQAFQSKGRVEYGSVECGLLALENQERQLQVQQMKRMVETVPRADGQFDIVVTVLDNPSFPLLRFRIGDLTSKPILHHERGPATLTDVMGRNNDFLVNGNGGFIHANAVKHALEHIPRVKRFQAIQDLDGSLEVLIENQDGRPSVADEEILLRLKSLMEGYSVTLQRVERIQGNLAGKHTWVKSALFEQTQQSAV